jgi:site-specific recombinase XerD/phage-related protein
MLQGIRVFELCDQFEKALIERNYAQSDMCRYLRSMKAFKEFTGDVIFTPQLSASFLTKMLGVGEGFSQRGINSKLHMYYIRTIRSLEDYYLFGTFLRRHNEMVPITWPESFRKPLIAYFPTIENRGVSSKHQYKIAIMVRDLILYLYRHYVHSFEEMRNEHVTGFIASQIGFQPNTMAGKVSCLRGLFRFLYLEGYISIPLFEALPKVRNVFRTTIPTVWKPEELQKVKESIDLGNPTGKRDYAIVMLAASTGLRGGDIINLKLSNINWEKKEISIVQNKTSKPLILPLMDDVGWAIIDYIKNGKPESQYDNVFLRHLSPFEPFPSVSAFYKILTRYVAKAGVKPGGKAKAGMHSLRHTLASELLQNNVEINTIADILGHSDPETTRNYLKVNITALSKCTLEVIFDEE